MHTAGHKSGNVRLTIKPLVPAGRNDSADRFIDWVPPVVTSKSRSGRFVTNLSVPAGVFEYRFVIDMALDPVA